MKSRRLFFTLIFSLIFATSSFAFREETHEAINLKNADSMIGDFSLNSYLTGILGFNKGVYEKFESCPTEFYNTYQGKQAQGEKECNIRNLLQWGGRKEDDPEWRSFKHYHNPLQPWDKAGLKDSILGRSSIVWAQSKDQPYGNYSWQDVRGYFYLGLTSDDKLTRESYFVETFRGLGQLMHLIQDASVPLHTRDDIHIIFSYEGWVGELQNNQPDTFDTLMSNSKSYSKSVLDLSPNPLAPIPIAKILDTDQYTRTNFDIDATKSLAIGLAEYSNGNFFSESTAFSQTFPFPNWDSVEQVDYEINDSRNPLMTVLRQYYKKVRHGETNGAEGYRLATVGFLKDYVLTYFPLYAQILRALEKPALDANVYRDYASLLMPRAVGYSAGLLEYFFRGNLQVTPIPIFYKNGIQYLRLKIKNKTPTEETMSGGHFLLTYQYTKATPDGPQDVLGLAWADYPIRPEANNTELLYASDQQREEDQDKEVIDFLIPDPIPLESCDSAKFMLTFKGTLGNEDGAVIGKALTLGEVKFAEEWDNGFTGNHNWAHTDFNLLDQNLGNGSTSNVFEGDTLIKDNIRFVGHMTARVNESFLDYDYNNGQFRDNLPILITPDTYLQFKIDAMSINEIPPALPGYTNHWQALILHFNNGLSLQYFQEGQGLYTGSNTAYLTFPLGLITVDNIYEMFKGAAITIPEPLYLESIDFLQQLLQLEQPSTVQHHQHMEIDSILIIEGKQQ